MTEALYERYKDALRRGHVAALRGRSDAALAAYGEAARLAPDRALPFVGIGTILARAGDAREALAAFDRALERSRDDEAALRGRADAELALGRRSAAAATLDRLADSLARGGRPADALDAARRALELAESRDRRTTVTTLVERLAAAPGDPAVTDALRRATGILDGPVPTIPAPSAPVADDRLEEAASGEPAKDGRPFPPPVEAEPEPEPAFDPGAAIAAVDQAAEGDDPAALRRLALDAARGHRAGGQPNAAIDVCYIALATSPADPGLHLALAEVYLDQGWREAAAVKLTLLHRLAALADDDATREQVCAMAAERLAEDPHLGGLCT